MENPDVVLEIEGMMCQNNCAKTVLGCIKNFSFVKDASVTHATGLAEIWLLDDKNQDVNAIIDAIECVGYGAVVKADNRDGAEAHAGLDPNPPDATLYVEKMRRFDDLKVVNTTLLSVEGVVRVDFELTDRLAYVWGFADSQALVAALLASNYIAVDNASRETVATVVKPATVIRDSAVSSPMHNPPLHPLAAVTSAPAPSKREYVYSIRGMSCGSCAAKIEKMLVKLPGVVAASVSVMTHQGMVTVDDRTELAVGPRDIIVKVEDLGYACKLITGESGGSRSATMDNNEHDLQQWRWLLAAALVFGVPVLLLHSVGEMVPEFMMLLDQPRYCHGGVTVGQLWMLLLNAPMLVIVGHKYYQAALIGASHGMLGMDFLVMTGTSITFAYSLWQLYLACDAHEVTEHVFFETTGMLLLFVTIGKYIEAYAKGKSASAMAELLKLQPSEALLVSGVSANLINSEADGSVYISDEDVNRIDVELVQKGDIVKVLPGDRIPTDGVMVMGTTSVDESMITGESNPVHKEKGDLLFGSTVNQDACIYLRVTSYGSESALAQIVRLVETAQLNKAPVQDYADRIASIFTPFILVLAVVTFVTWLSLCEDGIVPKSWFEESYDDPLLFSLLFAISVVVISCPCALGLATPTAIMVGTVVGANNGILIKGGSAFEMSHKVDTVIFDKTGTLTEGKPSVSDVVSLKSSGGSVEALADKAQLLLLAATAEQCSEHPLAQAVLRCAKKRQIAPLPLQENASVMFVGSGVSCASDLGTISVGNRNFMKSKGIAVNAGADAVMWNLELQGKTAICVALDSEVQGILGISDTLKRESESVIRALRNAGVDVWMITGDNATTAEALANKLDLPQHRVLAGVLPQDKSQKVRQLQEAGHVVAMVGDGINDSPALVQANLGIAIGAGTQIAIESASMVLIRNNLHDLVVALDLAKVVFNRIRWNFLWAILYNVVAIPFAAGVWFPWTKMALPPHYAGLAMAASSISVVVSSMLLKLYRRPTFEHDAFGLDPTKGGFVAWLGSLVAASHHISVPSTPDVYDHLPVDDAEAEEFVGLELGTASLHRDER